MGLPNLSKSMDVARLRYIQSIHESPQHRNPDTLVRHFIPILARLRAAWLGRERIPFITILSRGPSITIRWSMRPFLMVCNKS